MILKERERGFAGVVCMMCQFACISVVLSTFGGNAVCLCLNVPFVETAEKKADLDSMNNSTDLVTRWTGPSVSCRSVQSCLGGLPTQASADESTCSAARVSVFCSYFKSSAARVSVFCSYF